MGKTNCSQKVKSRKRNNWLINRMKFAKQALLDNLNKRQKKEYNPYD